LIPLALSLLGLGCLALAGLALRRIGPGYRIARLLAAAPEVTLGEALSVARHADRRYVRVRGRISSEEEFPDEHDRPLVYRRSRLETVSPGGDWQTVQQSREAVPFGLEARSAFMVVDADALGEGLVVLPREAVGRASDLPPDLVSGVDPETASRLVVEQISAVEHAIVAGVPTLGPDGRPIISAGGGRPLVLTTLELQAAMRLLARGHRRLTIAVVTLLVAALGAFAAAIVALWAAV
jgi:hypothetical protein